MLSCWLSRFPCFDESLGLWGYTYASKTIKIRGTMFISATFENEAKRRTREPYFVSCFGCQTGAAEASRLEDSGSSSVNLEEYKEWGRDTGSFFLQSPECT